LRNARLNNYQNRLRFVVDVAEDVAKKLGDESRKVRLGEIKAAIEYSRFTREDTLADESMNEAERKSLRRSRSAKARHWNLLTDFGGKGLGWMAG